MGYKLKRREGFAGGIARIVDEQLEGAVEQLRGEGDADFDEAVHDVRKRLKKSRSALRLARYDLGDASRSKENEVLRRAGRQLSGARDAQVLLETLALREEELTAPTYRALRAPLERKRDALGAEQRGSSGQIEAISDELDGLRGRIDGWGLGDESFASAERGLRRIHKRGRDAMQVALADGSDEHWHEWRKRVKDLWYSLRILRPVARTQLAGMVDEADELSDILGDHNDLAVLLEAVEEQRDVLSDDQAAELRAAITRRRDRLRLSAVSLGRRLYAEAPRGFGRRVGVYWSARDAEAAAAAHWLTQEQAEEIKELLERKSAADGAEERRLGARLRERGFKVSELGRLVKPGPADFGPDEFDKLVERGQIRIGEPPPAREFA
jgi:CHAD domain-containing protein